ncbi:hypothetical protein LQM11_004383 [Vibrio parahaemolyticus]|nr:hypothetical protein [Vibrio parahaemolyticus]
MKTLNGHINFTIHLFLAMAVILGYIVLCKSPTWGEMAAILAIIAIGGNLTMVLLNKLRQGKLLATLAQPNQTKPMATIQRSLNTIRFIT